MNAEERRPTEQLKLRLMPAQADAIRAAAAAEKKTISDYVYDLHAGRRTPAELLQFDALCEVDRHLAGIPEAVRKLDADLGRLSGRLANFFTADPGKAMAHQSAINEALRAVRDLRAEVLPVLADLQVAIAEPRDRLGEILGAIVRRRKRPESA
jgi:hypothetical protein